MGIRFKDVPQEKNLRIYRATRFKPEDGVKSMAFSERLEIQMDVTKILNNETKKELQKLMEETLEEAKRIIAADKPPDNRKEQII